MKTDDQISRSQSSSLCPDKGSLVSGAHVTRIRSREVIIPWGDSISGETLHLSKKGKLCQILVVNFLIFKKHNSLKQFESLTSCLLRQGPTLSVGRQGPPLSVVWHTLNWTEILRFGHQFSFIYLGLFFKILDKSRSVDSAYFCFDREFPPDPRAIPISLN